MERALISTSRLGSLKFPTMGEWQRIAPFEISVFARMMARQARFKNGDAKRSWRVEKSPTIRSILQDSAVVGKICVNVKSIRSRAFSIPTSIRIITRR